MRAFRDRRWTLFNPDPAEYRGGANVMQRTMDSADTLVLAVRDTFPLPLDDHPELDEPLLALFAV